MSTIVDVSAKLGEYMLKGWVLTDDICSKCSKVPLMRSPSPPTMHFCANCDAAGPSSTPVTAISNIGAGIVVSNGLSSASQSSIGSVHSRSSTPPTDLSAAPSSPGLPPVNMEEIQRRRQQSDRASAEIGKRMLRGWAMLADECPNSSCFGIPLVRPPKLGPEKDPSKECVICETIYVDRSDVFGQTTLVRLHPQTAPEEQRAGPSGQEAVDQSISETLRVARPPPPPSHAVNPVFTTSSIASSTTLALQASEESLQLSLHALSVRLNHLSGGPVIEPSLIAQTADAIAKVSQALTQVKQLHWSEQAASHV